jgi:hypothetical protein
MKPEMIRATYAWNHGPVGDILSACIFSVFEVYIIHYFHFTIPFLVIVLAFAVGIAIRLNEVRLFASLAPYVINVDGDSIVCKFLFHKRLTLQVQDITAIRTTVPFLQRWTFGVTFEVSSSGTNFICGHHMMKQFDSLVALIRRINPECLVDDSLLPPDRPTEH